MHGSSQRRPGHPRRRPEDPRHALGRRGEQLAAEHLRRRGLEILDHNVRSAAGEIDLIATDGARLVFVEVKCRRCRGPGPLDSACALEAIDPRKQARLRRVASEWLRRSVSGRPFVEELRFDAIAVVLDGRGRLLCLDHLEGAW